MYYTESPNMPKRRTYYVMTITAECRDNVRWRKHDFGHICNPWVRLRKRKRWSQLTIFWHTTRTPWHGVMKFSESLYSRQIHLDFSRFSSFIYGSIPYQNLHLFCVGWNFYSLHWFVQANFLKNKLLTQTLMRLFWKFLLLPQTNLHS